MYMYSTVCYVNSVHHDKLLHVVKAQEKRVHS